MFETTAVTLHCKRLPAALDGLRIAHVSDLHGRRFGGRLRVALLAAHPDFVAATGDMLEGPGEGGAAFLELARALCGRLPLYYVRGNHEQRMAERPGEAELLRGWERRLAENGVCVLNDRCTVFQKNGARLCIYGLSLPMACYRPAAAGAPQHFCSAQTVAAHLGEASGSCFHVLLAHTPLFFPSYAAWGADVVLSGHIHGGLWRLPHLGGLLSPYQHLFPAYDAGVYRHGGATMVLSRGLGDSRFRFRLNNPPELILVTLRVR